MKYILLSLLLVCSAYGQRYVRTFATVAEMLAARPTDISTNAIVLGYYAAGDGGGGNYYYSASSSATTNYGSSLKPNSYNGRWLIPPTGDFDVKRFGAKGDGTTVDTVRLQDAITAAYNYPKGTVVMPPGTYRGYVTMAENVRLRGFAQQGQKNNGEGTTILKLPDGLTDVSVITTTEECAIENLQIDGNKTNVLGTSYGIFFNRDGIYIESTVEECSIVNAKTAGIYIDAHEITVRNSSVIDSDGYGIYVDNCYDTILQSVLVGWSGNDGVFFGANGSGSRITSLDSYYSRGNGVTFTSPFGVFVDRLQVDFSFKHGIEIVSNSGSTMIDIGLRFVYASNAPDDGAKGHTNSAASGTYSDICISGSTYPSSIILQGGRVGSFIGGLAKKAAYSLVWSNSVSEVGWGTRLYDINMDTISGTRTDSGKTADDGWINKFFWQGRIQNYYDGTNNYVLERTTMTDARWDFLAYPPIKSFYGTNSIQDLNIATNLVVGGSGRFGGASAGRDVNVTKLGVQVKSDTGTAFGISNFGDTFYIASESGSNPSWQMKGLTGNTILQSTMSATSGVDKPLKIAYTINQASGTADSSALSLEATSTAIGSGTHNFIKAIDDGFPRFEMRLDGRMVVTATNGISPHVFKGDTGTDSQIYLHAAQTLDRRLTLTGNTIAVTSTDGTTAQTLSLNSNAALVTVGGYLRTASGIEYGSGGPTDRYGAGTPEGAITAPIGSTWRRTDGGAGTTFYVKESGTGNTGWVAK